MNPEASEQALAQLATLCQRMPDIGWSTDATAAVNVRLDRFSMAHKRGEEIIFVKSNAKTSTR